MTTLEFGEYLADLLRDRTPPLTAKDLAAMIIVDPSYLRRWIRGESVPDLDTTHVDRIATALSLSDAEYSALLKAQSYSLAKMKLERKHQKSRLSQRAAARPVSYPTGIDNDENQKVLLKAYFEDLVSADSTGKTSIRYWHDLYDEFYRGNFAKILPEVSAGEDFIYSQRLHQQKRGKLWLVAFSAVRGSAFSHALPRDRLRNDEDFGLKQLARLPDFLTDASELAPYALHTWGAMVRIGAELAGPRGLSLLLQSLDLQRKSLNGLAFDDPLRVAVLLEAMATAADIESLDPEPADSILGKRSRSEDYYQRALNTVVTVGGTAQRHAPALEEFRIRLALRRAVLQRERGHGLALRDEAFSAMEAKLDGAMHYVNDGNGIVGITLAVTRVKLYQAAGVAIPGDVRENAIRLVLRANDFEQADRLREAIGEPS